MPFNTPTHAELITRVSQDMATRLGVELPEIRRTNASVFAQSYATVGFTAVEFMRWISEQVQYDLAEAEILERWAGNWAITRIPAAAAGGDVIFAGTDASVIPADTVLVRADGVEYTTDAEATIASGTATVAVSATVPGAAGNADAAEPVDLVSPIAGVTSRAAVDTGLTGGADAESDDSLRARFIARLQTPPHGGAAADYLKWTLETDGVTAARRGPNPGDELVWAYPQELGLGTVSVRFMADDGAGYMRLPTAPEIAAVQAYIDTVRPVTAEVTVVAPVSAPLDLTIALTPDTATVRAAVEAEINDLLLREAVPGGTILISHLREAVSIATGETDNAIASPTADVTHSTGEIAMPGTITWS